MYQLPLGAINNQRSLAGLENLVDFIGLCGTHPRAANEVFLISDGEDVSTTELFQRVAKAFGKKERLIPVPVGLMNITLSADEFLSLANSMAGHSDSGFKFSKDPIYYRRSDG